jgi:hypothetical protein
MFEPVKLVAVVKFPQTIVEGVTCVLPHTMVVPAAVPTIMLPHTMVELHVWDGSHTTLLPHTMVLPHTIVLPQTIVCPHAAWFVSTVLPHTMVLPHTIV